MDADMGRHAWHSMQCGRGAARARAAYHGHQLVQIVALKHALHVATWPDVGGMLASACGAAARLRRQQSQGEGGGDGMGRLPTKRLLQTHVGMLKSRFHTSATVTAARRLQKGTNKAAGRPASWPPALAHTHPLPHAPRQRLPNFHARSPSFSIVFAHGSGLL